MSSKGAVHKPCGHGLWLTPSPQVEVGLKIHMAYFETSYF